MKRSTIHVHGLALVLAPLLASCANLSSPRTGFLDDYSTLERASEEEVWGVPDEIHLERAPDLAGRFDAVIVDPVAYRAVEDPGHEPDADAIEGLRNDYRRILVDVLGEELEVVTVPGPRTARVRASIAEVNPSNIWINWLGVILVVPPDMGGISGELEVLDASTGERALAMTAVREGTPFLLFECFTKYGHARHGMKKWARGLRSMLAASD